MTEIRDPTALADQGGISEEMDIVDKVILEEEEEDD